MDNKKILEAISLVIDPNPQVVRGVVVGATAGKRITSGEIIADRPVRKNFVQIVFILMGG